MRAMTLSKLFVALKVWNVFEVRSMTFLIAFIKLHLS